MAAFQAVGDQGQRVKYQLGQAPKINAATLQLTSEAQVRSFGDPDKIDMLVVTGGHGFNRDRQ
jgi:hypothetical protein